MDGQPADPSRMPPETQAAWATALDAIEAYMLWRAGVDYVAQGFAPPTGAWPYALVAQHMIVDTAYRQATGRRGGHGQKP